MLRSRPCRCACIIVAALALLASNALAREIHLDCVRGNQTAMVDIDSDRVFMQIVWGDGVAEEFKEGDSYISGPDNFGRKEKVVYVMRLEKDLVTFGTDRNCLEDGVKKCVEQHVRNTLDVNRGEMRYDEGDSIAVLRCNPAPPGRRF
jgi:hypothetical protein